MTKQEIAQVAADANVDPRTVARALNGRTRSDVLRTAIHAALVARGHVAEAMTLERPQMHTPKQPNRKPSNRKVAGG